jgi:hypothetical protein
MLSQEMKEWAVRQLQSPDWKVRLKALRTLAEDTDPLLVDDVLPLVRDPDEQVRRLALLIVVKFDDRQILSELIAALDDIDEDVRALALELLNKHSALPALTRVAGKRDTRIVWRQLRAKAQAVVRWASQIGQELLGKPVIVRKYAYGLGRTHEDRKRQEVEIEISDAPVTSGHPHGEDIMRGLVLHELGHHLYDIGARGHKTTRGIARSEGIDLLYDILCDERLERKLRARRSLWGIYFDRLAAYAFAEEKRTISLEEYAALVAEAGCRGATEQKAHVRKSAEAVKAAVEQRQLPGDFVPTTATQPLLRIRIRNQDLMTIPGAVPVLGAFLLCLRGGIDPRRYPNPQLTAALAQIPRDLKNLSHAALLEVARKIAKPLWGDQSPKDAMQQMQQLLRKFPHALFGLRSAFDRLARRAQTARGGEPQPSEATPIRREQPHSGGPDSHRASPRSRLPPNPNPAADFPLLGNDKALHYDPERHAEIVIKIHSHINQLRAYLECLKTCEIETPASRQGRRLDIAQARKIAYRPTVNLMVSAEQQQRLDGYLGIVIDRSESMEGERLERAIAFAVLLAESAKGLVGLEGHVNAFDGETFYRLGDFQQTAVASLWASGGNNDAGALARAAELALQSRKRNKALIMISDGAPAQCSFASLQKLVTRLTREHHIGCAQVAVAPLAHVAFPQYIDVSRYTLDQAVARFGRLLMQLTSG